MMTVGLDWSMIRRELLRDAPPAALLQRHLDDAARELLSRSTHGDLERYRGASHALRTLAEPARAGDCADAPVFDQPVVQVGRAGSVSAQAVRQALLALGPWRKGPFQVAGVAIDAEWRSNLKWQRVQAAIDVRGCSVLDVGSGNGYYAYRALGAGARCVLGIDPTVQYAMQFEVTRHFVKDVPAWVLPLRLEDLPQGLSCFDITLSMGVLYHRPSPLAHLRDLRLTLKPGGTLILETLVIVGGAREVLVPEGRYAGMRNVYFLPSCEALLSWLRRAGFDGGRVVEQGFTSTDEQRATAFSQGQSLADFLDPSDPLRTVEGEPAPLRALIIAHRA